MLFKGNGFLPQSELTILIIFYLTKINRWEGLYQVKEKYKVVLIDNYTTQEKKEKPIYGKSAKFYDIYSTIMWFGLHRIFRNIITEELELKKGDIVLEIGCGTGLNFSRIQKRIGTCGKIIGIDISKQMLDIARKKVKSHKWKNIRLIQADFSNLNDDEFDFLKNAKITKILMVLVAHVIPKYERVIQFSSEILQSRGKIVIGDLKKIEPRRSSHRIFNLLFEKSSKKFGQDFSRTPWKVLRDLTHMKILADYQYKTKLNTFYFVSGTKA